MKRLGLVTAIALVGVLVTAPTVGAVWFQQNTVILTGTSSFNAVSCPSSLFCMAVGSSSAAGGFLGEFRSGGVWFTDNPANPTNNTESLNAISCVSTSFCMAVGSFFDGTKTVTLAELYNGGGWTVVTTPNPAGASSAHLNGIQCRSATFCIAVGDSSNGTLAENWNGSVWTIHSTPNPVGATSANLQAISCTAGNACEAAGGSSNGSLAEVWNGTGWAIQTTANPITGSGQLGAVSCTASNACTATGLAFAERWNGSAWSLQTVQVPPGNTGAGADLLSVSCTASNACIAAGSYFNDAVETMVVEGWNGTAWHVQSTSLSTSADSSGLSSVVCNTPSICTAVGFYHDPTNGDQALAEVFTLEWQTQNAAIPSGSIASELNGVSCTSPGACNATGLYEDASNFNSLDETWNGTGWTQQSTPSPTISNLDAVSCWSVSACTAVGDVLSGSTPVTLAERWNGSSWTVQPTPNPAGATRSFMTAVSCSSATTCTATGWYENGSGQQFTLAEGWNGSSWTIQTTPNPTGTFIKLNGVSCRSATFCIAVGSFSNPSGEIFALSWNGSAWSMQAPPVPTGGSDSFLSAVSCAATNACIAVGDYFDGTHQVPLADSWNGSTWSAQSPVAQGGAHASDAFTAVSCRAANFCIAVGSTDTSVGLRPMAERGNGSSWFNEAVPLPSGGQSGFFQGVSCTSLTYCEGVGNFNDSSNTGTVLAEQLS